MIPYADALPMRRIAFRLRTDLAFAPKAPCASDLRGAIGKVLHGTADYEALFAPPLPDDAPRGLGGGEGAPRPFVLQGALSPLPEGGSIDVAVVAFGAAALRPDAWVEAVRAAATLGFGEPRASFAVDDVHVGADRTIGGWASRRADELCGDGVEVYLQLTALTQLRMFQNGEPLAPSPGAVANGLLRRLSSLAVLHAAADEVDYGRWVRRAVELEAAPEYLEHFDAETGARFSRRQGRVQPLDGAVGAWRAWMPRDLAALFAAAELVHVGKSTSHGLGQVRLSAPVVRW